MYEQRQAEDPLNVEFTLGRMRCLAALGMAIHCCVVLFATWDDGCAQVSGSG